MKQLTGAQIVLECLKEQGVDTVFGYPGGAILNIYDELYKQKEDFTHILTSHEQGASHAADGYARSTGKVGVCFATSGPGATNTVTGIATAYMDSVPMVVITCNVGVSLLGKDSFQEVDISGITLPITKHNFIVKDVHDLADTIRRAFRIAESGRPGPVLIDIPKDVTAAKAMYEKVVPAKIIRSSEHIRELDIQTAIQMIEEAKKPFVLVGGGAVISDAADEVNEFVEKVHCPVCDTLMGKGAFDGTNALYTGMIGMHGTKASNLGVSEADLLIAIGTRFSDRVLGNPNTFAKNATILQIDIDPVEINKNIMTNAYIVGDIKAVLTVMNRRLTQQNHNAWVKKVMEYKVKYPLTYDKGRLTCPQIIEKIYERTKGDAIITTEVGQHQMWAAQFFKYDKPRKFLTSGGLGTMGYGLGASLGAKMGNPDKTVINIAGDGCFRMNLNELATASRYNIPIIEVIINNSVLGMVRQWQDLFYEERYSYTTFEDPVDFVKVSEGFGVIAKKVTNMEEFEYAFEDALDAGRPVVLDCHIDLDDKVWPMVNPGGSIEDAFDKADLEEREAN
ncbi:MULTISPECIES: biosynthetic-type acetolactate synthase large subunit [Anaerostipes]|uniref:biosynthetic-type acetolactate synthase large subunit n=1 Tax=Anaerostipes TaxID=207244 RepID=UPI0009527CF3|nr:MULTISPECIES: biosynthetic-type acetolactate synthase large subunit [Anaerostipes]MCI5623844.1 biosynthetic-type acetolactate synthase large subunit [Anaerostipes sp.]OLR58673.1 acetolactate synthase, large subunit, biosynthetic type [Anaerostipes sp. 494a]